MLRAQQLLSDNFICQVLRSWLYTKYRGIDRENRDPRERLDNPENLRSARVTSSRATLGLGNVKLESLLEDDNWCIIIYINHDLAFTYVAPNHALLSYPDQRNSRNCIR